MRIADNAMTGLAMMSRIEDATMSISRFIRRYRTLADVGPAKRSRTSRISGVDTATAILADKEHLNGR